MWWEYYVLVCENGKMTTIELFQDWERGDKGE
jgi:hypothetical protein